MTIKECYDKYVEARKNLYLKYRLLSDEELVKCALTAGTRADVILRRVIKERIYNNNYGSFFDMVDKTILNTNIKYLKKEL